MVKVNFMWEVYFKCFKVNALLMNSIKSRIKYYDKSAKKYNFS